MQVLLLVAVAALSAACAAAETPPPPPPAAAAPTPLPTSQPAPAVAAITRHDVQNATASTNDASSTPSSERLTRPSNFVPSPQVGAGHSDAHVDGWLASPPLHQPPSNAAPSSLHQHTTSASQQVNQPSPSIQESEFMPMVHYPLRRPVLPEAPGGAPGKLASDPVEEYLDAIKSQLHRHGERPASTGRGELHGGHLEGIASKAGDGDDYTSVQEYLKTVQADFAAAHQQQEEADFPAVWGASRARGKPVRFEEDASQTQPLVLEGARAGALPSGGGGFPYQYGQPGSHVPEVAVQSAVGPKHHGGKKVGVVRPSPRSSLVQKVLHALAAFIPLGLFLASIQPSVITVNASAPAPGASRQRSVADPGALLAVGAGADCEAQLLCEAATRGRLEVADASERALWLAAHQTPEKVAKALGLYEILKAIRTGTCDLYNCRALQDEQLASSI